MADVLLTDDLPFEDHISEDVALLTSGAVVAVFAVSGVYPETADDIDIAAWFDRVHLAWRNIAADDIEVSIYDCRGEATNQGVPSGTHTAPFAREVAAAYEANLARGTLYSNQLFIAVHIHPPARLAPRTDIESRCERLNELCSLLENHLAGFGLRRLGYRERNGILFDEIAEAFVFALTGHWRPIGATTGRMGNAMFSERIHFRKPRLIEIDGPAGVSCAAMFAMREYPVTTMPGMFRALATASYRNTLVQSFRFLSNAAGISAIGRKQNKLVAAQDKAYKQIAALDEAANDLMERKWVLGDHSLALIVFAADAAGMARVSSAAWTDLSNAGLVATRLTKALQAAFLSMLPGGHRWRPRPGFVKSSNFVAFAPMYGTPAGVQHSRWGPPIMRFRTIPAGTPYDFSYHVEDVGSTLITGRPGSGKTLLTAMLITHTCGRARVIALDHKRGWQFLIQRLRGDYAVLGAGEPNFAPLKALDASPKNLEFLTELLRGCIGAMTEEEGRRLTLGLSIVMEMPAPDRSLRELRGFFDDRAEGAGVRLERWCHGNELGWVLDAPRDRVGFCDLTGLDVTALLDHPRARGPAMAYLFYRILGMLDGTPLLIPIDEGWRALLDETFRNMIEVLLRTIRSKNGVPVFITQDPGDLIESKIARVLTTMCPTHFCMANPRGSRADYVDGLQLTPGQFEAFHPIQPGDGTFLLIQGASAVVAQMPMSGEMAQYIPLLSAPEAKLREADAARELEEVE